jgi:hypothetical protein
VIRGEALTAGRSATLQFSLQIVEVHHEGVDALASEGHQEIGAVEAGDASSLLVAIAPRAGALRARG